VSALVALVLVAVIGHQLRTSPWRGSIDYSTRPPASVFKRVTGQPVPAGVTNLRIAGRSYLVTPDLIHGGSRRWTKHWVWMSFDATDAAMQVLVNTVAGPSSNKEPMAPGMAEVFIQHERNFTTLFDQRYDHQDRQHVQWSEVRAIPHPEVRVFGHVVPTFVWAGILIFDRQHRRGYIWADGN
jgi:hypothetical protein